MDDESAMQEILDNKRGHRVNTHLPSGEPVVLRRTHNGIQMLFPERRRRYGVNLSIGRQQDKLGVIEE